jgi:hypothetical protein
MKKFQSGVKAVIGRFVSSASLTITEEEAQRMVIASFGDTLTGHYRLRAVRLEFQMQPRLTDWFKKLNTKVGFD